MCTLVPPPIRRGDVVNVEVQVLVHTGLQAERPDDSRSVVLLAWPLRTFRPAQRPSPARLSQRGGVMAADGVLGVDLSLVHGHLLWRRQPDVAVKAESRTASLCLSALSLSVWASRRSPG